MPEEKVSTDTRTTYGVTCTCDKFGAVPCPLHSFSPAADAGPRQHEHYFGLNVKTGESVCAVCGCPPVPQEAAPRQSGAPQSCRVPLADSTVCLQVKGHPGPHDAATAPEWAMRVAREIDEMLGYDNVFVTTDEVQKLAALIRQAGSERECALENGLRQLIDHSRRYKNGWMGAGVLEEHLAEASRLLGGESNG